MMGFLAELLGWLADPANWTGGGGIARRLVEHLWMTGLVMGAAVVTAIPPALVLAHFRRAEVAAVAVVNLGRALPTFGIISLGVILSLRLGLGLGFWPTFLALFVLALPPIFTNTYTAVREVDPGVVESGRGMGMREREVLLGIELPLAGPVIMAATRVSALQVVATAPLGALVAWGGLGRFIIDGLAVRDFARVGGGAVLVALLALAVDAFFGLVERWVVPARQRIGKAPERVEGARAA